MITAAALVEKFRYALDNKWGYIWGTAGVMWTQAKQDQKIKYLVSTYGADWKKNADAKKDNYYNCGLYGAKWIGHMVADCSGMFVWAFKAYNLSMSHISSNIYKSYCSQKGKLTDDLKKTIPPGTAVFTGDTATNHPHVGLYVGNGKCIEASGTQAGVCVSNITATKWKWYGLLKNVEYSNATPEPVPAVSYPTVKRGNKGEYVRKVQTILQKLGYNLGVYGIDGDFGTATEKAVQEFQKDHHLTVDGVVGPKTWAAMEQAVKDQENTKYTVTISGLTKEKASEIVTKYGGLITAE